MKINVNSLDSFTSGGKEKKKDNL